MCGQKGGPPPKSLSKTSNQGRPLRSAPGQMGFERWFFASPEKMPRPRRSLGRLASCWPREDSQKGRGSETYVAVAQKKKKKTAPKWVALVSGHMDHPRNSSGSILSSHVPWSDVSFHVQCPKFNWRQWLPGGFFLV